MTVDLSTAFGRLRLKNPIATASGTFGYGLEFADYLDLSALGAISVKGHGRFQIADQRLPRPDGTTARRTYVVIAHRFGYAALNGVDALLQVPVLAHQCDNPLCQNPRCWRESNHRANGRDYAYRRDLVRGALTPHPRCPRPGRAVTAGPR